MPNVATPFNFGSALTVAEGAPTVTGTTVIYSSVAGAVADGTVSVYASGNAQQDGGLTVSVPNVVAKHPGATSIVLGSPLGFKLDAPLFDSGCAVVSSATSLAAYARAVMLRLPAADDWGTVAAIYVSMSDLLTAYGLVYSAGTSLNMYSYGTTSYNTCWANATTLVPGTYAIPYPATALACTSAGVGHTLYVANGGSASMPTAYAGTLGTYATLAAANAAGWFGAVCPATNAVSPPLNPGTSVGNVTIPILNPTAPSLVLPTRFSSATVPFTPWTDATRPSGFYMAFTRSGSGLAMSLAAANADGTPGAFVVEYASHPTFFGSSRGATGGTSGGSGNPVCFLRRTMIATPHGEVPIESLGVGDLVLNTRGRAVPITEVYAREWDVEADVDRIQPYRIPAGVYGAKRDLLLSRRHGIVTGESDGPGGLIGAGRSARAVRATDVRGVVGYHHLRVDAGSEAVEETLILAEGVPCESMRGPTPA